MINTSPFISPFTSPFASTTIKQLPTKISYHGGNVINIDKHEPKDVNVVNYVADNGGCAFWRVIWPTNLLLEKSIIKSGISLCKMVLHKEWYEGVTCVKLQRQATPNQLKFVKYLKELQKIYKFKLVYEIDDVLFIDEIPKYNKFRAAYEDPEISKSAIEIINLCDELVVTCDYMKFIYHKYTGKKEITVIPNFIPYNWFGHMYNAGDVRKHFIKNKNKPRVLYTGSGAHYDVDFLDGGRDDMEFIRDFIYDTVDKYQWVFVGMYPRNLKPLVDCGKIEFHNWVSLHEFPKLVSSLNCQAMIAPLKDNSFNRSKSDIKFVEGAILGIPTLCQDIETYKNVPEEYKFSDIHEFGVKLRKITSYKNKSTYFSEISKLREFGLSRILENHENHMCHYELLTTPYGSPSRKYLDKWN